MRRVSVQNTCRVLQPPFQQRAADGSPPVKMLGKKKTTFNYQSFFLLILKALQRVPGIEENLLQVTASPHLAMYLGLGRMLTCLAVL